MRGYTEACTTSRTCSSASSTGSCARCWRGGTCADAPRTTTEEPPSDPAVLRTGEGVDRVASEPEGDEREQKLAEGRVAQRAQCAVEAPRLFGLAPNGGQHEQGSDDPQRDALGGVPEDASPDDPLSRVLAKVLEELLLGALEDVVDADTDDREADRSDEDLACGLSHQLRGEVHGLLAARRATNTGPRIREGAHAQEQVDDGLGAGLHAVRGLAPSHDELGDLPEAKGDKADHRDPEQHFPDGVAGKGLQRPRLVRRSAAAALEPGHLKGQPPDEQVEDPTTHVPHTREVFQGWVVAGSDGHLLDVVRVHGANPRPLGT